MERGTADPDERAIRRPVRAIYVLLVVALVTAIGTAVTYSRSKDLFLEHGTRAVVGTVVSERSGPFGVWNDLTVTYEVDGVSYRETIPVKGNGFGRGFRLAPYFYEPGHRVDLLVLASDPSAVRTRSRWTPAWYEWGVVAAWSLATALGLTVLVLWLRRRLRRSSRPEAT